MKNILRFNQFQNEEKLNEEILGKLFSKLKTWVSAKLNNVRGWTKKFYQNLLDGKIRVTSDGRPVMMLFDPANGSVLSQLRKSNILNESIIKEARVPLEYMEEDESVPDVGPDELFDLIDTLYDEKTSGAPATPLFIFGAPGIGKTEIVAQAADRLGISMLVLLIAPMEPEDLTGVPKDIEIESPQFKDIEGKRTMISPGKGTTRFNPSDNLPQDNGTNGKGGIIFMDEFNKAKSHVIGALNQFVQKGEMPGYKLPSKWIIVAAGNRPSDKVDISPLDASMVDRFDMVNYVPEIGISDTGEITGGWAKYVTSTGKVLPELIYFIASDKEMFHYLDQEKAIGKFPTPRGWTNAAISLHRFIQRKGLESWRDIKTSVIQKLFHQKIGPMASAKFAEFLDVLRELSDSDMISILKDGANGRVVDKFKQNLRFIYVISHNLLKKIPAEMNLEERDKKIYNVVTYIAKYKQFEILTWILARVKDKYKEWNTVASTDNKDVPGFEWRKKGMEVMMGEKKKAGF